MQVEIKFLGLFREVAIGDRIDGWSVCWIGGWDKCRVVFVEMVAQRISAVFQREVQIFTLPSSTVASPDWKRQRFRIGDPSRSKKCWLLCVKLVMPMLYPVRTVTLMPSKSKGRP
jgi:hypothetical protein